MAHLFNNKGVNTTFATKKEIAWHGLGKVVDAMTSEEAIKLGGMNFEVAKLPLYFQNQNPIPFEKAKEYSLVSRYREEKEYVAANLYQELKQVPDAFTMIRTDTQHPFGYVGKRYEPIQNIEAFEFFDDIIGHGHAQYETVGALGNGEVVFITAKLPDYFEVAKSQIDKYLLLTMSHDGSSSITVMFTPIRVVCNNTLSMALQGSRNKITIKHTKNARNKLELAKATLGLVNINGKVNVNIWEKWAKEEIKDDKAQEIFEVALGLEKQENGMLSTRALNILNSVENYYHAGIGQSDIVGTKWGVYNAVTGYFQNVKDYKTDDKKFNNLFLSGDNDIRQKTANLLMTL